MGSSGKGGSSGTQHISATIAAVVCWRPVWSLHKIILNGEIAWEGDLNRTSEDNPVNIVTPLGTIRFYWGTEDQAADSLLNQYEEHPPYRGIAYAVFVDFDHGQSQNAYNAEFVVRVLPQQSLVTGAPAANDGAATANPIAIAAEIVTAPWWLGIAPEDCDDESWQAVADDVQSEEPPGTEGRGWSASAISPLYTDAVEARRALVEALAVADAWLRIGLDGRIECGRWRKDGSPPSVTELTFDDLSDWPQVELDDEGDRPNSYAIEFTDSEALHKEAKITVDDLAALVDAPLRRATLKAHHLTTYDQALRAGQEALRRVSLPGGGTWRGEVRQTRAVAPGGAMLLPGDYVRVPVSAPGEPVVSRLLRITRVVRPRDAMAPVEISGEFDRAATPVLGAVAAAEEAGGAGVVMPPVVLWRVLALPAEDAGETPPLHVLAARPHNLAVGMDVLYDDDSGGDFPAVGQQRGFAVPVSLVTSTSSGATTVRVSLLADGSAGEDYQRDAQVLTQWQGGETEGRNDELLLVLLRKTSGVIDYQAGDLLEWVEVMSVSGSPSLVSGDTYDVPVLRGRLGTGALAFTDGSFPDAWSRYEGWVIARAQLAALFHADFDSMLVSGDPGYFRVGAFASRALYAPETAWAERERRDGAGLDLLEYGAQPDDTAWEPEATYSIPPGLNTAPQIDVVAPDPLPGEADPVTGELAVDVDYRDATGDLVRAQLYSQRSDGSQYQSHTDANLPPSASHNYADTIVLPVVGSYTLSAVATDASGLVRRRDVTVTRAAPAVPTILPAGSDISDPTNITITAPAGCTVEYQVQTTGDPLGAWTHHSADNDVDVPVNGGQTLYARSRAGDAANVSATASEAYT